MRPLLYHHHQHLVAVFLLLLLAPIFVWAIPVDNNNHNIINIDNGGSQQNRGLQNLNNLNINNRDANNNANNPSSTSTTTTSLPLPFRTVFQFSESGSWIESIVTRQNGDMLFTTVYPNASLYLMSPNNSPDSSSSSSTTIDNWDVALVKTFPGVTSLEGITEVSPDSYLVVGGNTTGPGFGVADTWQAWVVTFPGSSFSSFFSAGEKTSSGDSAVGVDDGGKSVDVARRGGSSGVNDTMPLVSHVANIPGDIFLNGVAPVPLSFANVSVSDSQAKVKKSSSSSSSSSTSSFHPPTYGNLLNRNRHRRTATPATTTTTVLLADSLNGAVLGLDLLTGDHWTAASVPEMAPVPDIASIPIGVNGLKVRGDYLYWSNSFASSVYRMPLSSLYLSPQEADDAHASSSSDDGDDGSDLGVETVITIPGTFLDDFTFGPETSTSDGDVLLDQNDASTTTIWLATNPNNTVLAVRPLVPSGVALPGGSTPPFANTTATTVTDRGVTICNSTIPIPGNNTTGGGVGETTMQWETYVVAGLQSSLDVAGATSVVFASAGGGGAGAGDDSTMMVFVCTSGGLASPVNGTTTEPAKIVMVNSTAFWF